MKNYTPPFTITGKMLTLTARIAEKTGKLSAGRSFETKLYLRKNNRIRSVHSSLAIEANSLSQNEMRDVINGKTVIGSEKEIQEVKNAFKAYDLLGSFDPYSLRDLKKLHAVTTYMTVDESGVFRNRNEGVFDGDECIFMAPPPNMVPDLMRTLFSWMRKEKQELHPLVLSSVFHYEFVFIHPFLDGNGRMARLWQKAILSEWDPVFQNIPIENQIYEYQDEYYKAITASNSAGNSNAFIEFMLEKIDLALDRFLQQVTAEDGILSNAVRKLLQNMEYNTPYSADQLMKKMNLRSKDNFRNLYLNPALEKGLIVMSIPDKPRSKNQAYIRA